MPSTSRGERATLIGAGTVLVVLVLANDWGVLTPDTKPEVFLAPWRTLVHTAAVWQDSPFLGAPNFNVGLVPVTTVTGLLAGAGLPPWLVLRVWRIALLLLAAAGCRRLYSDLVAGTPADTPAGRVAAAVAFVANPYLLLGGATTPTLLPFALLPWFLLALRRGFAAPRSWRAPAVAALLFAAMSGINAGVVPLIQLVAVGPLLADARRRDGRPWRELLTVLARTALLMTLLSLYWLVPALSAVSVGAAIAGSTESNAAIAATSSYAEVLRGLGLWTLYGADAAGPFQPGLLAYLGSPLVVAATFAVPVVAAAGAVLSRSPVRRPAVAWLATAAVVMVGLHPPDSATPFGRLLEAAFEHVPGAVAFRTTNKAGAVLVLGVALLTALGAAAVAPRLRTPGRRSGAAVAVVALVVGVTAPAWTGDLFGTRVPLPDYWRDAAAALDGAAGSSPPAGTAVGRGRVLLAPGSALTRYRWGYVGPDELGNALLERPTTYRSAVPAGTPAAANLLAGTDTRLQEGTLPPGALSALARYAGATEVLLRDDKVWELDEGARPAEISAAAAADPGLRPLRTFGRPGENTVGPRGAGPGDDRVPPLEWFAVTGAQGPVRQVPAAGAVIVDGDGEALPDLVGRGLLAGDPALLYAGSLDAAALARVLRLGARVVLTDTNRRVSWNPGRVAGGTGPLLPSEADPGATRALFGPEDQTVAVTEGTARVTASGGGLVFGPLPYGDASLAVDGDPTTAWLTGNFEGGVGDALTLTSDRVVEVPAVRLRLPPSAGRRVTRVRVVVSGGRAPVTVAQDLPVAAADPVVVAVPGGRGTSVRVEIAAVAGPGFGPVGIAEVTVPGLTSTKVARLPTGLARRVAATVGGQVAADLDRTPVDVLLRRRLGTPQTGIDDEEPRLARDLTLPASRRYVVTGHVRFSGTAPDALLARLLGQGGTITATSSSRAFNDPGARATAAIDGMATGRPALGTAWRPADPLIGEWIEVRLPRGRVDGLTVTQPGGGAVAVGALVSVDGRPGYGVQLGPGAVRVPLPPQQGSTVRLTLTAVRGDGPVRIQDLAVSGARVRRPAAAPAVPPGPVPCLQVATLDGAPLLVRPTRPVRELAAGAAVPFTACGGPLALTAGTHRLRPRAAFAVDDLVLRDRLVAAPPVAPAAAVDVLEHGDTRTRARTSASGDPYWLVAGRGLDPGWSARADGVDLGPPVLVDGYSAGWLIADGRSHLVDVSYAPQGRAIMARAASIAAALACVGLVAWPAVRRRRRRPPGPAPGEETPADGH